MRMIPVVFDLSICAFFMLIQEFVDDTGKKLKYIIWIRPKTNIKIHKNVKQNVTKNLNLKAAAGKFE